MRFLAPLWRALALVTLIAVSLTSAPRRPYSIHEKAFFADDASVELELRPYIQVARSSFTRFTWGRVCPVLKPARIMYKSTRLDGCLGFRAVAGEFVSVVTRTGVRGVAILPNDRAHINVS